MKDFFVADAPRFENRVVTTYFRLASISLRDRKGGGGQYLALNLTDKTGQLEARMWEEFASDQSRLAPGALVTSKCRDRSPSTTAGFRSR